MSICDFDSIIPPIIVAGIKIQQNEKVWRVATNRHPTTGGADWGWIEGAPGNICWENRKNFDRYAAGEAVRLHNSWLESQKPRSIKIIEARDKRARIQSVLSDAEVRFKQAKCALDSIERDIRDLLAETP